MRRVAEVHERSLTPPAHALDRRKAEGFSIEVPARRETDRNVSSLRHMELP